jgi:hypothetical protein
LQKIGVTSGQGWALGKPMSGDVIALGAHGADFITDWSIRSALGLGQTDSKKSYALQ